MLESDVNHQEKRLTLRKKKEEKDGNARMDHNGVATEMGTVDFDDDDG